MRSKTSDKHRRITKTLWKATPGCSEAGLIELATQFAARLAPGERVALEGPLGAGKTTFARALIQGLGVSQPPEGSPTFAIAHEYACARATVAHIDFYRLRSEAEIDEAGIPSFFWERPDGIVICEWLSSWPGFAERVFKAGKVWRVDLAFSAAGQDFRDVAIYR